MRQDIRGRQKCRRCRDTSKKITLVLYEQQRDCNAMQSGLFLQVWLSNKERRVDALALRADERRDKLRKAAVRSKYPLTRRYLNGETRQSKPLSLHDESIVMQREPGELKHLSTQRKRKKNRFPE